MSNRKFFFVIVCGMIGCFTFSRACLNCFTFSRACPNCIVTNKNKKQRGCGCPTSDMNFVSLGRNRYDVINSRSSFIRKPTTGCCDEAWKPSYHMLLDQWLLNQQRLSRYRSCDELYQDRVTTNAGYNITIYGTQVQVYCEFQLNRHNWMVFQKRRNGIVDFYQNWVHYENGFGNIEGEFWVGLKALHLLTRFLAEPVLRIDLEDFEGNKVYAEYSNFMVEGRMMRYRLWVGGYSGNAGDSLSTHNGAYFSTFEQDNDRNAGNLAFEFHGAWWYNNVVFSNLNGAYLPGGVINSTGIGWFYWKRNYYSMRSASMKIRPGY